MAAYKAAVAAHQQHDLDTALKKYQEVLRMNPNIAAVHNNVAAILLGRGDKLEAEKSWRSAVTLKPEYAEAHYNLAVLLSEKSDDDLAEAEAHALLAIRHKESYPSAFHLMGNILMSQRRQSEATAWYARAEGDLSTIARSAAAAEDHRWDGVEVGHVRTLRLPNGSEWHMRTLSMHPLVFLIPGFLSDSECERLIDLARPRLKASLVMGDADASERTSESVFLGASEDELLANLQHRLAALAQLPPVRVATSEDLQLVHYTQGATFGMHHDSSKFLPRYLTAFYYLNEPEGGGETAFPAADGAMTPAEAMALKDPAASGGGLIVKPIKGAALLWYNHGEDGAIEPAAVHAGCRVSAGEKWGANHWVRLAKPDETAPAQQREQEKEQCDDDDAVGETKDEGAPGEGKNAAKNRRKREKLKAKKLAESSGDGEAPELS